MKPTKYMSLAGYEAAARFIHQAAAHEANPNRAPKPDLKLLLVEPTHGPITHVELAGTEDHPLIAVSYHGRNLRYLDPLDHAALTLATAFGMGLSVQDTGGGMAYPRLRVKQPKGLIIYVLRVLMDVQPWRVVQQHNGDGDYVEYHHLSRRGLSLRRVQEVWEDGNKSRVPKVGRSAFYEAVTLYWTDNHLKAGIAVSLEDHLDSIKTALVIGDRALREPDIA